jgi:hypothetical protein
MIRAMAAIEETGAMGREIESHQSKNRVVVFIQTYYNRERFFNVGGWLGRELGIF